MPKKSYPLSENWSFKNASKDDDPLRPVAQFPTNVHLDLLQHDLIPEPFFHKNEQLVQWVGEDDWLYSTTFATPSEAAATSSGGKAEIVFEGLDTYATVTLNGKEVLKSDNMFVPYRVDVTNVLKKDGDNTLEILFESAFIKGKKIQEQWPDFAWGCWNGDPSRLAVRKAQYHYGWDWGPVLMTCGPWRPIRLETFDARIDDLSFTVTVAKSLAQATVAATAETVGDVDKVVFTLTAPDGESIKTGTTSVKDGKASLEFTVDEPKLWYPAGHGEQPLYKIAATIGDKADVVEKKLGLRRVLLVERALEDAVGKSFFFEVNTEPVWCAGVNWIPADNFLPRLKEAHYRKWLDLVKHGRYNMIRVWGGGIYEDDSFYDICDELGILVWQDFGFGCGNYPGMIESFQKSVEAEAVANIKRMRHHPSIVLWAGNNEDYSYMWSMPDHLGYDPTDENPENWLKTQFPARYIYEKILPSAIEAHGNGAIYHRGSPYGGVLGYGSPTGPSGADTERGDIHQWNVWHGTQEPYQNYDQLAGRFVSEFGMDALPTLPTLESFLPEKSPDAYSQSRVVEWHSKADGAEGRLGKYLLENIPFQLSPVAAYVYATQIIQSEALTSAYRSWRRNWKGPGREYTAGAIVWQINDCWPVTSWAIVDYYYRPKLAYYAIRRELAPVVLGTKRTSVKTPKDKYTNVYVDVEHRLQIWSSSLTLAPVSPNPKLVVKAVNASTGETVVAETTLQDTVEILPNRSTELKDIQLPGWDGTADGNLDVVVKVSLVDPSSNTILASTVSWPEPLKYVNLAKDPGVKFAVDDASGEVKVTTQRPVKGLVLEVEEIDKEPVQWSDNNIDLISGDEVTVVVQGGLKGRKITAHWLGKEW